MVSLECTIDGTVAIIIFRYFIIRSGHGSGYYRLWFENGIQLILPGGHFAIHQSQGLKFVSITDNTLISFIIDASARKAGVFIATLVLFERVTITDVI